MGEGEMAYRAGLNRVIPLGDRLAEALRQAHGLDLAWPMPRARHGGPAEVGGAAAQPGGGGARLRADGSREGQPADVGVSVRCVIDSVAVAASQFHPKLYLASQQGALVVLSGSANLTGGVVNRMRPSWRAARCFARCSASTGLPAPAPPRMRAGPERGRSAGRTWSRWRKPCAFDIALREAVLGAVDRVVVVAGRAELDEAGAIRA